MKKAIIIFYTLFIWANCCNSQKIDTTFFDKKENITTQKGSFLYLTTQQDLDTNIVKVAAYSKKGQILSTAGFKSFDLKNMKGDNTGPFKYYKNGRLVRFELYEPSKYPHILESLNKFLKLIPALSDSLYLEIRYYKNNSVSSIGYRSNCCSLHGTWIFFSANGKEVVIENYVNNVVSGPSKLYYLNNLWCSGSYKNGKKDGEWQYYLNSGKLAKTKIYQDGRRIKVIWNTDQ